MSEVAKKKRYALVGTGARCGMYIKAILGTFSADAELVGFCDVNQTRMRNHLKNAQAEFSCEQIPFYGAEDFEKMLEEQKVDVVIVTTIDRQHHHYIIRAMECGCDAVTEKPMTVDVEKCKAIVDAVERTGRSLRVTFNYRYSPARTKVKDLLMQGVIGKVKAIHFEWLLDTVHGADYFRRWHRDKRNSGGLMVHKATHHFDLVNWWLDSSPETVFGLGDLKFYGRENAEGRGVTSFYDRGTGHPNAKGDPFALDLSEEPDLKEMYKDAEHEDGYLRDQSVFGDGINIEDTMNVVVRYKSGTQMSYTLSAYNPWEGYKINFIGEKGRIELEDLEKSYISAASGELGESLSKSQKLLVLPHWEKAYEVEVPEAVGGHGGGDDPMLESLFSPHAPADPYGRTANHIDGARSILTGLAANQSFMTGLPVQVDALLCLL
ncbi:Gfo/Idh/MocA family oxidoreductase [Kiritimatiellota bacterium B12222]|nr:Gfo/Idh/MocA family oxidoreductase [Kiritimatiellota bacterium B12222]